MDVVEREYFAQPAAIDDIEAAEERLIDEYLDRTLSSEERQQFETHYLASPQHRERVATIRRLHAAAPAQPRRRSFTLSALALAAVVALATAGVAWFVQRARHDTPAAPVTRSAEAVPTAPAPPRVFAISISPVTVRGAGDAQALVIPAGTDAIDLRLEAEGPGPAIARGHVVIRTVAGVDVWQGPVLAAAALPTGTAAHVEVPAARLVPDDYVVTLFERDLSGADVERARYFLRVRR
jgi:hypothetical protein